MVCAIDAGGDGSEVGDVDFVEAEAIDVGAREIRRVPRLDRFARHHDHRLVQRALAAAGVHGAVAEQIEHANYPHASFPTPPMVPE
jgi:hypothetical protein